VALLQPPTVSAIAPGAERIEMDIAASWQPGGSLGTGHLPLGSLLSSGIANQGLQDPGVPSVVAPTWRDPRLAARSAATGPQPLQHALGDPGPSDGSRSLPGDVGRLNVLSAADVFASAITAPFSHGQREDQKGAAGLPQPPVGGLVPATRDPRRTAVAGIVAAPPHRESAVQEVSAHAVGDPRREENDPSSLRIDPVGVTQAPAGPWGPTSTGSRSEPESEASTPRAPQLSGEVSTDEEWGLASEVTTPHKETSSPEKSREGTPAGAGIPGGPAGASGSPAAGPAAHSRSPSEPVEGPQAEEFISLLDKDSGDARVPSRPGTAGSPSVSPRDPSTAAPSPGDVPIPSFLFQETVEKPTVQAVPETVLPAPPAADRGPRMLVPKHGPLGAPSGLVTAPAGPQQSSLNLPRAPEPLPNQAPEVGGRPQHAGPAVPSGPLPEVPPRPDFFQGAALMHQTDSALVRLPDQAPQFFGLPRQAMIAFPTAESAQQPVGVPQGPGQGPLEGLPGVPPGSPHALHGASGVRPLPAAPSSSLRDPTDGVHVEHDQC
jgi:hypothetical protein